MRTRRFFAAATLTLLVVVAFNLLLAWRIGSVAGEILRRMRAEPKIDVLFLGNSLMQSGIDAAEVSSAWPANAGPPPLLFNAGLGSSSPVEHYIMAQQTYAHDANVRLLVYGFYDYQLTTPEPGGWDDLTGNRSVAYTIDPVTAASLYAPGSTWQKWRFRLIGAVPLLASHSQVWKHVEILRRMLGGIGLPAERTNQFGRTQDFEAMAAPQLAAFERECRAAMQKPDPLVPAMHALIDLARTSHTRLLIVEMPMTSEHRERYYSLEVWRAYRAYLQQVLAGGGVSYVVASDFADDSCFGDGLHLNSRGTSVFSARMAPIIAAELARP